MYTNWKKLSHLPAAELKALQNKKLKHFVQHYLPYSPYYRGLFERTGLKFSDIQTTDDLQKIPLSSKEDIAPSEDDRARPRQFILQPDEKLIKKYASKGTLAKILWGKITKQDVHAKLEWEFKPSHIHFTTGRTALPTPFTYSRYDLELLKETGSRLFEVSGITHDSVGLNAFPYSPHLGFWLAYYGFLQGGLTALATGGGKVMGTQKIMDSLERLKVNAMAIIPGYGYHLMREAVKQKRDFSNMKFLIFGAERVSPAFRDKMRELLTEVGANEVKIIATYASTEFKTAWIQCSESTGYHLYPDLEFVELVDPEGKRVRDGEPGEVVYSALDWRGTLVMRYRTGDLAKGIEYDPCPNCGRTVPRILPDIQRKSDFKEFMVTKLKGESVNLNNVFPLMSAVKGLDEWQLVIGKKNDDPHDMDELRVAISVKPNADANAIQNEVATHLRNELQVTAVIEQTTTEELVTRLGMETELKEKRIVDSRPKT